MGIFGSLLTIGDAPAEQERSAAFSRKPRKFERSGCYGLLAMGNGHAPGTATGFGIAGTEVVVTGFLVTRRRTAGLAVFFFAAFLTAGFLAGFFLVALRRVTDFFVAGFFAAFAAELFLRTDVPSVDFFFAAFFVAFAITTSDCVCDSGH